MSLHLLRNLLQPFFGHPLLTRPDALQVAALCLRRGAAGPEVLMITSRGTGRWVIPKGWPIPDKSLAGSALTEAWEEAGVIGTAEEVPMGHYHYQKSLDSGLGQTCRVEVFRVAVTDLAEKWPERKQRRRDWVPLTEAAGLVAEPELRSLLLGLR